MPRYLITYHGGHPMPTDPENVERMRAAFQSWIEGVGDAMRDPGGPLGPAKTVVSGSTADGQSEASVIGYSVVEASTLDDAVELVSRHPFLGGGGSLQVSELLVTGR